MTSTLKESPILTKHRINTEEQLDLLRLRVEDIDQLFRDNADAISQIDKNSLLDDDTFDFYSKKGMCDYLDGANYLNSSIKGFTMMTSQAPEGLSWTPVRTLRRIAEGPREIIFAVWTAFQLYNWYRDNRYCGRCGSQTTLAGDERAVVCPGCNRRIYPRIIPAVIVGVTNGDEILMTKYRGRDIPYYALIAGFTEIGETLEQTVAREVMEEAGLKVKNIRYYKSQPWAIVDYLLAGFYCDVDGYTQIHMDENELKEAVWVRRENVVGQPNDFSLTNEMMLVFRDGKEPK